MLLLALAAAAIVGSEVSCAPNIEDTQSAIPPEGAESLAYLQGPRRLERMLIYSGHPSERALLMSDAPEKNRRISWEFSPAQDIWIQCIYGNSAALITYHVGRARRCTFLRSRGGLEPNVGTCVKADP